MMSLEMKGVEGGEEVKIADVEGNVLETIQLSQDWQPLFYTVPYYQTIQLKFTQTGARDVMLNNAETLKISYLDKLSEWKCGSEEENDSCQHLRNGMLKWSGKYLFRRESFIGMFNLKRIMLDQ